MRLLLLVLVTLVLAAPAVAAGNPIHPVAHPSCHCKARIVKHERAWWYWTIVDITDMDGHHWTVWTKCHVNRKGVHSCDFPVIR